MLRLKNITKVYQVSSGDVHALKGIDICFRKNEFVSILGPSGCGKTTTLNIVGGLDKYTTGDLIIEGQSTKGFNDRDWDVYRNHRIGFVFQSYNLIPHQTVLGNVELALTISGVSKEERVKRAKSALDKVGLKGEYNKRPNQLSGGQCQRVAIARALVNEPDILLADEPTGALDSKTSVQIMELIKEISKEKLVIMVTHNAEIAEQYSTRIVRLVDGEIIEDTMPFTEEQEKAEREEVKEQTEKPIKKKKNKAKMSPWTAFKLSMRNLFTKKGRTILTSFAGSIGIIGISLILAVSQGTTAYINNVQESTLSSYPLTLEETSVDLTSLMESFMGVGGNQSSEEHKNDAIYKDPIIAELVNALSKVETNENDLKSFKTYLTNKINDKESQLSKAVSGVQYSYNFDFQVYTENVDKKIVKSDTGELMSNMIARYFLGVAGKDNGETDDSTTSGSTQNGMFSMMASTGVWEELLPNNDGGVVNDIIYSQYDKIYGEWPKAYDEVVLIVNEKNEIDDLTLYALGLIGEEEIDAILDAAIKGEEIEGSLKSWSYKEVCEREYRTIMPYDCYKEVGTTGLYTDWSKTEFGLSSLYSTALKLKVVGIIRPNDKAENHMLNGTIGYTYKLTEHIINNVEQSDVIKAQLENPNMDILTGLPFRSSTDSLTDEQKDTSFREYANTLITPAQKAKVYKDMQCVMSEQALNMGVENVLSSFKDGEGNLNRDALVQMIAETLVEQLGGSVEDIKGYFKDLTDEQLLNLLIPSIEEQVKQGYKDMILNGMNGQGGLNNMSEEQLATMFDARLASTQSCAVYYDQVMNFSNSSYQENMKKFGYADIDSPSTINIYASSFKNKDVIVDAIKQYNDGVEETKQIKYTDYMGIMMSSITTIIDAITYVLIAFVAISLVVSSIMISVIVLISVQERTKEIGVLRSIGASKRDVSNLFNAETVIIGFASGLLGVLVTYTLCIPINIILKVLTGLNNLRAFLPIGAAVILVAISVLLNFIAGLIPSRSAAKKDPVVALRTE